MADCHEVIKAFLSLIITRVAALCEGEALKVVDGYG